MYILFFFFITFFLKQNLPQKSGAEEKPHANRKQFKCQVNFQWNTYKKSSTYRELQQSVLKCLKIAVTHIGTRDNFVGMAIGCLFINNVTTYTYHIKGLSIRQQKIAYFEQFPNLFLSKINWYFCCLKFVPDFRYYRLMAVIDKLSFHAGQSAQLNCRLS